MSEQPIGGISSKSPGDPPTRDPALGEPASAHLRTLLQSGDTVPPEQSSGGVSGAAPAMPELSIGAGSSPEQRAAEPPKLDGYDVIIAIGEGGMGTVWRAVQHSTRRNVALKLISSAGFASERARQRFDREVEITARLEHPNIARVYDSGINRGIYFYAMELIDGMPLDQYVTRHKLARADILRLFALVCRAVHHAHERGVIHRDLKPGNILVSPDGQPHVLDFGLAKALLQAGKEAGISIDGEVAGTPGFMSPEQACGRSDLDARCDVYSLGVILYRLLTGQSPHDLSGTYIDVLRRISDEEPKRPRAADKTMDRELEALILCALQRDISHRYKTAGELAQDIENFLGGDPITAKPPTLIYFVSKRARKHRVKIASVSIVLLLAGLAAMLTIRLRHSHEATIDEQRRTQDAKRRAAENERLGRINAAINADMGDGNADFYARNWTSARQHFLDSIPNFALAGRSPRAAYLALWDLSRAAPQPLLKLAPPIADSHAAAPNKVTITGGAMLFLSDNRRALAGCDDGTLRMWDIATGRVLGVIPAHHAPVRSVSTSADGQLALSAGADGTLKLWNLETGTLSREFPLNKPAAGSSLKRVALSPNGRRAISASGGDVLQSVASNDTLTLWDAASAKPLLATDASAHILDVNGSVTQTVFSPDSSKLLTGGQEVAVWSVADGKKITSMSHTAMSAVFSPDGSWIGVGSSSGAIHLLHLPTQAVIQPRPVDSAVSALWFDPEHNRVIAATEDGALRAMDMGRTDHWSQPARGDINAVAISPDGRVALTATDDGLIVSRLLPQYQRELALDGPFPNVSLSRDGRLAVSRRAPRISTFGSSDEATLWDVATGKKLTSANFPANHCNGIAMSRDGKTIASVSGAQLSVWSLDPPHEISQFNIKPAPGSGNIAVALCGDGSRVAVSAGDHSLLLFRVPGVSEPTRLTGHTGSITSIDFSADGNLVLTGSDDRTARLWDATSGQPLHELRGHGATVNSVALCDDGKIAVTGSGAGADQLGNDNSVRTWDVATGTALSVFSGDTRHKRRVRSVAISGDGSLIASGDDDQKVVIQDRATGEVLRTLACLHGIPLALAFDQDGSTLTCGADSMSIWNLGRPQREGAFEARIAPVRMADASKQPSPSDLLSLGQWYTFAGEPAWAATFLEQARAAGQAVPALELARCEWERGDEKSAERELRAVSAQEAPGYYVKLCMEALRRENPAR